MRFCKRTIFHDRTHTCMCILCMCSIYNTRYRINNAFYTCVYHSCKAMVMRKDIEADVCSIIDCRQWSSEGSSLSQNHHPYHLSHTLPHVPFSMSAAAPPLLSHLSYATVPVTLGALLQFLIYNQDHARCLS